MQAKNTEIQNAATDIAVEFRQLLGFVETRNENPKFDYGQIKVNFETIATSITMRLATLQASAQATDPQLRDKCQQLAKLLRAIIEDIRQEFIASSPGSSAQPAHANTLATRLQRSTGEAVALIKSVLAAAQGGTAPATPTSTPPAPFLSPPENQGRPLPTPIPNSSSSSARSYTSPAFVQQSPARSSTSSSSSSTSRPLTLTRTNSSPQSLRDSARVAALSAPASSQSPSTATAAHDNPAPLSSLSPLSPPDQLSAGMHRSASLPHHIPSPQPLNLSTSTLTSPRRSVGPPKRAPSVAVSLLVDGTTSHSNSPNALVLLIDKRKDPALTKLVRCVLDSISWISDISLKSKMLAFFVGSALGKIPVGDYDVCRNCANNFSQLREKYAKDPCPLGEISYGYARHRALLYKYLADSMSLPARIHTAESTLRTPDAGDAKDIPAQTNASISVVQVYLETEKKWVVVDLLKDVGELYDDDSPQAQAYKQTSSDWEDERPQSATSEKPTPTLSTSSSSSNESSPRSSEILKPSDLTSNGDSTESSAPPAIPAMPAKASAKPRARAGTTGLPSRPTRHSTHTPGGALPSLGKSAAKSSATHGANGRVLRLPVENAEIVLNERIGKGTFGDVYRCRISGYTCAVKIVNIRSLSEAALKMLHNEIFFLESLSHENIIGCLGHEEIPKREVKIFMEFMPLTLANIIQKRYNNNHHFNKKDLVKCAKGMAEALAYLHHRKIIHRDIKSSNVLLEIDATLDRIQEVRLCDFGVSKATETAIAITFTGTNLWVAPEVFDVQFGVATSYDEKCDIWSFGMVLVEMVTLNPPYHGSTTQEATQIEFGYSHLFFNMKDIRNGITPSLEANSNIEESISNLIYSCLKKDPSERPSANDLVSMINNL